MQRILPLTARLSSIIQSNLPVKTFWNSNRRTVQLKMASVSADIVNQFEERAKQGEALVAKLSAQVDHLRKLAEAQEVTRLEEENKILQEKVAQAKAALIAAEAANGKVHVPLPSEATNNAATATAAAAAAPSAKAAAPKQDNNNNNQKNNEKNTAAAKGGEAKAAGKKDKKKGGNGGKNQPAAALPMDISRVLFKVGRIVKCERHPDPEATKLYVEQVDMGDGTMKTVQSALAEHIPIEEFQNRLVICCANMKPRKMKGIDSEAMIMCASNAEKIEFVEPPAGSVPGDVITVPGFEGTPDDVLNPKKKVLEAVLPDLGTDENCFATYQGKIWEVKGKGQCKVKSLKNAVVK